MADERGPQDRSRQFRRETKVRFGRSANTPSKRGSPVLRFIGAAAILSAFAYVLVVYGPPHRTKHGLFDDWFAKRREAQRQQEIETDLQHVMQLKRETDELLRKSKSESEAAWKKFDERMQSFDQPAPREKQAKEQQVTTATDPNPATPEQHRSLTAHKDAVVWLSASPDGSHLLSASTDKSIKLWDIKTGLLARDVGRQADMVRAALFLPGGKEVLSGADDGVIDIWSAEEGRLENSLVASEYGGVRGLAISGDGKLLASSHESGTVVVWALKERRKLHVLTGHQWPANAVAISPDGTLAVSGDIDGVIRSWDISTGKSLRLWKGHGAGIYGAAFLPDGKQVVTASGDGTLKLWNVENGREIRNFPGHAGTVYAVSVSADGKKMLSGSLDGTARLWDIATGEEIAYLDNSGNRIYSVALLGDGAEAVGDESGTIKIFAAKGGGVQTLAAKADR